MVKLYAVVETARCRIEDYYEVIAIFDNRAKADAFIASKPEKYDLRYYVQPYELNGGPIYE